MNEEYMNFEQAAEFLNTPRSTLYRWLKEGRVPGHKIGRQWRFLRAELDAVRRAPDEDEELAVGAGAEEPSYFQRWILTHLPHKESTPMTSPVTRCFGAPLTPRSRRSISPPKPTGSGA